MSPIELTNNTPFEIILPSMTVQQFKEFLKKQWRNVSIASYDSQIILTPEIAQEILNITSNDLATVGEIGHITTWSVSWIWIDKEMLKQTVSRIMEKI
jgi:hypothetical protein